MNKTDIIITSRNRIEYLKKTLAYIYERTHTPYAIHIIDDNSDMAVANYLIELWQSGKIETLTLRNERAGIMANKNLSTWLSFSDPFVISADDLLCPDLSPDWLQRGLDVMAKYPQIGELDLNHPGAYRVAIEQNKDVTFCEVVGGTFGFVRRKAIESWHLPHYRKNYGQGDDVFRCHRIANRGYKVAFMNDVYCYHIGKWSACTESEYANGPFLPVKDWKTLEPEVNL